MELPKRYDSHESEPKWQKYWEEKKTYKFDETNNTNIFSIDTPPPYASAGHLHVGHGMHYSQFEFVARFQRMRGKNVFFPMGYDDNGLPTERFVEKKHNINKSKITRQEFIKLCLEETKKAGKTYNDLFTSLGFSIDWSLLYQTIGDKARRVAQKSFIDLYNKDRLERVDQPTTWCTTCQTTIAQADFENQNIQSHFNDIIFKSEGQDLIIATTRPELLPACVALFYNPEDERYTKLKGKMATVPLFNYQVPILEDESVAKDKGTGLMMVCTFGDKEDIEKWHKYKLPLRVVLTEYGKMNELAQKYQNMKTKDARKEILDDLKTRGLLIKQEQITHPVNVHERCGTELEFLKKAQWQIKVLDKKEELIAIAQKVNWYPEHMKVRYEHWVKNLQWNWGISRQRYYGVPFPVWYCQDCNAVILPKEDELPVDPRENEYSGKCSCGSTNIQPEMDVMDTWMTSSLTPEINADWGGNEKKQFLPMSLRPQGHDIIRTWAFYTIVKSYFHFNDIPWKDIMISGHGQDPHGQKMSKSKGNFVIAQDAIKKYSADAFRFWAASVKLGDDLPYQEKDVLTGQKFVNKLWNASKFSIMHLEDYTEGKPTETFDKWILSKLNTIIKNCTDNFEKYEYSKTKSDVEKFFWHIFCDQYLELVKDRLYNPDTRGNDARTSGQYTVHHTLLSVLKMMAPIMPHITEEIYQFYYSKKDNKTSIHTSQWPQYNKDLINNDIELVGDMGIDIINSVRKYKSENQLSMKEELSELILVSEEKDFQTMIAKIEQDLKAVCKVNKIIFSGETPIETEKFGIAVGIRK
ncbi:valine--tRNA ligase [Candidatus Woesearchaeota archaeon]|jgi:valyl-tRNA synthetase|nr:valine--tRNA ligase [Candidatus Woesearchaeota archaeon]MBT5396713.1 valine--tRNA ligase [Candidatus Woesearchaeota archaeon]MBT6367500.1 valine--tRNA ligase [Candidatus Woesearchaeota archaeon]MBT7762999.1 valine--tRNA ligase [Candidatus Woesearchaeota archaeon]